MATEVKQLQDVLFARPAELLRIPAKTTPWWDRMILAQTWSDTKVGGDVLILLWDIFPNCLKKDNDFFKVRLNNNAGNSCWVPQTQ